MSEETQLVHVRKQMTLTIVNRSGSLYMAVPYSQNKAWGFAAGDVVTLGVIDLQRPKPEGATE